MRLASTKSKPVVQALSMNFSRELDIHVGIDTSDLRKLCAILEQEGVTFIRPFKQRSDGMGFSAWVRDPDGHELELAERYLRT